MHRMWACVYPDADELAVGHDSDGGNQFDRVSIHHVYHPVDKERPHVCPRPSYPRFDGGQHPLLGCEYHADLGVRTEGMTTVVLTVNNFHLHRRYRRCTGAGTGSACQLAFYENALGCSVR